MDRRPKYSPIVLLLIATLGWPWGIALTESGGNPLDEAYRDLRIVAKSRPSYQRTPKSPRRAAADAQLAGQTDAELDEEGDEPGLPPSNVYTFSVAVRVKPSVSSPLRGVTDRGRLIRSPLRYVPLRC